MTHDLSQEARMEAASRGEAMPDGSYPARDCEELGHAVHAYGRETGDKAALRRFLIRRSVALGCTDKIPDDWHVKVSKDAGTTDSADSAESGK